MISIIATARKLEDVLAGKTNIEPRVKILSDFTLQVIVFAPTARIKELKEELYKATERDKYSVDIQVLSEDDMALPWYQDLLAESDRLDLGARYRLGSVLRPVSQPDSPLHPPIAAFYSYKGGVGRTTTMVAYAAKLASQGLRVAIIDSDIEAPGYLSFFNLSNQRDLCAGRRNGLVEYLSDLAFLRHGKEQSIDVRNYVVIPDSASDKANFYSNIILVPGGNLNETDTSDGNLQGSPGFSNRVAYLEGLSRLNLGNPKAVAAGFKQLIADLNRSYNVDVVLIDARTGFNDILGSVVMGMAAQVVGFFGYSAQSRPGLLHIVENYFGPETSFGLTLVPSILPVETPENAQHISACRQELEGLLRRTGAREDPAKALPTIIELHRVPELEMLGTEGDDAEGRFIKMITEGENPDYETLFEHLTNTLGLAEVINEHRAQATLAAQGSGQLPVQEQVPTSDYSAWSALRLSKGVLRALQSNLSAVKNFAEDCEMSLNQFFYRDCMAQIFEPDKFLIVGHKGTGKTYLYRALSEGGPGNEIRDFIRRRAMRDPEESSMFINIIPLGSKGSSPLECLSVEKLRSHAYDFRALWMVLLWNSLMQHPFFEEVYLRSQLNGHTFLQASGNRALLKAEEIISGGLRNLVAVEDDLEAANRYLAERGIELSVLYDRLDSVINPMYWGNAVSPLIAYWRENTGTFSNIHPKIFLRADLFKRIEGTNTARLKERNIVDIDWSLGEVFGYVIKLIYSDPVGRACLWQILLKQRGSTAQSLITNYENSLDDDHGMGQLPKANRQTLGPLVRILFGAQVKTLGDPWAYFSRELANADGTVSLRPFINTLSDDVLARAMQNSDSHVTCILPPDIYANIEVRDRAANDYFNDLASDLDFTSDLRFVRDFLRSDLGKPYRFKTLDEARFNEFLRGVQEAYHDSFRSIGGISELADLLQASGVVREDVKRGGKLYRFALMYHYVWALADSPQGYDRSDSFAEYQPSPKVGETYTGELLPNRRIRYRDFCYSVEDPRAQSLPEGTIVTFVLQRRPKVRNGIPVSGWYYFATQVKEEE